jgi:hypothetical protein
MKIAFTDYQGTVRKPLVKAIEEIANRKGKYRMNGEMKYAYDFGEGLELHRDGTLKSETDITDLLAQLKLKGFVGEIIERGEEPTETTDDPADGPEWQDECDREQPREDWDDCAEDFREIDELPPKKNKDIMDILVDEINANLPDGEHVERLHVAPTIIDDSGRQHSLDGRFAATPNYGEVAAPETIAIELPAMNVKADILRDLLNSKNSLIDAVLGADCAWEHEFGTDGLPLCDLPIEFTDDTVKFEWLRFGADGDTIKAWSAFLAAAVRFSKTAKRVTAKDSEVSNPKFAMRTFLVKLGMNGMEDKWCRQRLLQNLSGDSAFATSESKERWQAKHLKGNGGANDEQ